MKLTLEQIDLLRKRANVGYKEAKEAMEMHDGDIVEALAYLEGQNKTSCCGGGVHGNGFHGANGIVDMAKKLIKKGNKTFMSISRKDTTLINVPITIAVVFGLLMPPLFLTILVVALLTGCRLRFKKSTGEDLAVNSQLEKVSDIINETTQKFTQEMKTEQQS